MRNFISKSFKDGMHVWESIQIPSSSDEICRYLMEDACVDERGRRCLPTDVDDLVFEAAANLIENLKQKADAWDKNNS